MKAILDLLKSPFMVRLWRILVFGGLSGLFIDMTVNPDQWVPMAYVTVFTAVIAMIDKWLRDKYTK